VPGDDDRMRRRRSGRALSVRARRSVETGSIAFALAGLLLMIQPFAVALYTVGFWVLFVPGLVYVSTTFWPVEVSAGQAVGLLLRVVVVLLLVVGVCIAAIPYLL
jgi:hypothetical protein